MMKAVLDTNVLISSVISTGTPHNVVVAGFNSETGFSAAPLTPHPVALFYLFFKQELS